MKIKLDTILYIAVYYSVREKEFFEMISIQGEPVVNPKKRKADGMTPKWSDKDDEIPCRRLCVLLDSELVYHINHKLKQRFLFGGFRTF